VLADAGFNAHPAPHNISRELVLCKGLIDVDLHWGLLREGRLREDDVEDLLSRRQRSNALWMLNEDDTLFVLLVHPAFAKHVSGLEMGLHRVADLLIFLQTASFDWPAVVDALERNGVKTAAWATLRWAELLSQPQDTAAIQDKLDSLHRGSLRKNWLNIWLEHDLPARTSGTHWLRLLAFTAFLHDTPGDALRAFACRYRAYRHRSADLAVFRELLR